MEIVTESEVRALVGEQEALEATDRAFRALHYGRVVQPRPILLEIPDAPGELHVKGAYITGAAVFGIKLASGFYRNVERGLPNGSGLCLVFDAKTGFPLGLLADNGYLTDLRTAAAGALAAGALAGPSTDRLAIVGAGAQARYQARALARVCRWREARVWGRDARRAEQCASDIETQTGAPARGSTDLEAVVTGATMVLTVTPSRLPLVRAEWLGSATTVIAIGADAPGKQELDSNVLCRARLIVVDSLEQCLTQGELQHADAGWLATRKVTTLGAVLLGEVSLPSGQLTVCDLTGVGAQDAAIIELAWSRLRPGSVTSPK